MDKKAPDYSNSADIVNPPEVYELLCKLHEEQKNLEDQELDLRFENKNLMAQIDLSKQVVDNLTAEVKKAVEAFGSFQDMEEGLYAVRYRRMSKSYHVEPFKHFYPNYVPAVVVETINVKALEGLVKGGLLTEDNLKNPDVSVITETPTYAFYIR